MYYFNIGGNVVLFFITKHWIEFVGTIGHPLQRSVIKNCMLVYRKILMYNIITVDS